MCVLVSSRTVRASSSDCTTLSATIIDLLCDTSVARARTRLTVYGPLEVHGDLDELVVCFDELHPERDLDVSRPSRPELIPLLCCIEVRHLHRLQLDSLRGACERLVGPPRPRSASPARTSVVVGALAGTRRWWGVCLQRSLASAVSIRERRKSITPLGTLVGSALDVPSKPPAWSMTTWDHPWTA